MRFTDLTGQRFGRLMVLARAPNIKTRVVFHCECDCGNKTIVDGYSLRSGLSKSCRCLAKERASDRNKRHSACAGYGKTPEYVVWSNMIQRCRDPNSTSYERYGARGITVCNRWNIFENFLVDMGEKPGSEFSIEREINSGNYEPDNCIWADRSRQARNKRSNRIVQFRGKSMCLADAVDMVGLPYHTVKARISKYGWSDEDALNTPIRGRAA